MTTEIPAWVRGHTEECKRLQHEKFRVGSPFWSKCICGYEGLKAYAIPDGVVGEAEVKDGTGRAYSFPPDPALDEPYREAWEWLEDKADGHYWLVRVGDRCVKCGHVTREEPGNIEDDRCVMCGEVDPEQVDSYELVRQEREELLRPDGTPVSPGPASEMILALGRSVLFVSGTGERFILP